MGAPGTTIPTTPGSPVLQPEPPKP